jgi:hypothetical protein
MSDNLLEVSLSDMPSGGLGPATLPAADGRSARPAGLPDKFWDERTNQVRVDALIKSYLELERKLGALGRRDVPPAPEHYKIDVKHDLMRADPEINRLLHAAGFTQDQAQLVYDLAGDRLMPMIAELASIFEADSQTERLRQHFGGDERWQQMARQIDAWGRSRLPARVFEALSTTYEGVIAMHRMMAGEEPGLQRDAASAAGSVSEADLKQLMRDPRYWKQQDPAIVEKVREGFRKLYQNNG